MITYAVLELRSKYHISNGKTAFLQGGVEFIIKPFTYAFFEWAAAHVKSGYANGNGDPKEKEKKQK